MKVGDLVWVEWREQRDGEHTVGPAIILGEVREHRVFRILCNGKEELMHADYLEALNESR